MTNIVFVNQGGKHFLFAVPENVTLKKGDRVLCNTMRGEQDGICATDSFEVDEYALKQIATLTGAYFPLKGVVGRFGVVRFESKVTEDKQEKTAIKFNVGERYKVGEKSKFDTGNVIEITKVDRRLRFYKILSGTSSGMDYFHMDSNFPAHLIPYTEEKTEDKEPEKPKLYNGKVVATKTISGFTKGEIYEFIDGCVTDDEGDKRPIFFYPSPIPSPITNIDEANKMLGAKFVCIQKE